MAIKVTNLSNEKIDEICREIGDAFFDHDYGNGENGLRKFLSDKESMFQYMRVIFVAGLKSGLVYSTSERGEGYILLTSTRGEDLKISAAFGMIKGFLDVFGLKGSLHFMKQLKKGGMTLENKMKKEKKDFVKVEMLVVLKKYQGQGYMRKLMEIAYDKAQAYGVPCILDTDGKNKLAKYCHLGMQHVGTRKIAPDCILYDLIREV